MPNNVRGFTLVEILVALAIAGIVTAAVYNTFESQQHTYLVQDQVSEMQQNLRAAMDIMVREIRMAGYDPTDSGDFGILSASANSLSFTADLYPSDNPNGDVDPGETFLYQLYDTDGDGINDALRRTAGGGAVANNIYNIEFYYTLDDGTQTLAPPDPSKIRCVQVTVLARADKPDPKYQDTKTYTTPSGAIWGPFNDHYRRRLLTTTVKCRNMGLQ